jgi:hypothetical protein
VSLASGINPWLGTVEDPAYIAHEFFAIGALILTLLLQRPLAVWLATREPERESRRWELFCCASLGLVWFTALMVSGERMRWYFAPGGGTRLASAAAIGGKPERGAAARRAAAQHRASHAGAGPGA